MAQSQLLGADALVSLDRQRADLAAVELSAVPVVASTTAVGLARRFGPEHLAGVRVDAGEGVQLVLSGVLGTADLAVTYESVGVARVESA